MTITCWNYIKNSDSRLFQEGKDTMVRRTAISGVLIAGAVILLSAMTLLAQDKMFTYDYSFKPGSEPDGFRGIK